MDLDKRLIELARITRAPTPVVSVYLSTRWVDEHQRGRVRVFLKNELARARAAETGGAAETDLDWVQSQGEAIIQQTRFPEAHGVALFACQALGLRDVLPVRAPFADQFVVAEAPCLTPLAAMLDQAPPALVVFVDTETACLIPIGPDGADDPVVLEGDVPGSHSRGGWAQMAQSRYQRHIQDQRDRHFDGVAAALGQLVEQRKIQRIVMAGEPANIGVFRKTLSPRIAGLVAGTVAGARHEPASLIADRAVELLGHLEGQRRADEVDATLTEAAKSKQAVAGLDETLEAVNRGAVHRLYLHRTFSASGRVCLGCEALQTGADAPCRLCGHGTRPVDLGPAMAARAVATGGTLQTVEVHEGLARVGGVAAILRYPL